MVIPFLIAMMIFVWGAWLYFSEYRPPAGALEVQVVAKQWMWKFQHPDGRREINTLHVPLGQPVKLIDDFRGRDPQLVCPGVSHQARRLAGPL